MFTNVTCVPRTIVTFLSDRPLLVMVIVAPPVLPPGFGVGDVALSPPPQAVIVNTLATTHTRTAMPMIVTGEWP